MTGIPVGPVLLAIGLLLAGGVYLAFVPDTWTRAGWAYTWSAWRRSRAADLAATEAWLADVADVDPDAPVDTWPAYYPGRPIPATPAAVPAPVGGVQDEAALPGPELPRSGAGQPFPSLADLVRTQAHPLQPGQPLPRGEHPYPAQVGSWKETRPLEAWEPPAIVRPWLLFDGPITVARCAGWIRARDYAKAAGWVA